MGGTPAADAKLPSFIPVFLAVMVPGMTCITKLYVHNCIAFASTCTGIFPNIPWIGLGYIALAMNQWSIFVVHMVLITP